MAHHEFAVDAMIHGYHEYQEIWEAEDGEILRCIQETGNRHDLYTVAVVKNLVIGHVAPKISSICLIFIRRGGCITCTVTGRREQV